MDANGLDAMFVFTVSMGVITFLMAWIIVVVAIKGWAVRRENRNAFAYRQVAWMCAERQLASKQINEQTTEWLSEQMNEDGEEWKEKREVMEWKGKGDEDLTSFRGIRGAQWYQLDFHDIDGGDDDRFNDNTFYSRLFFFWGWDSQNIGSVIR
jgi:hypothetical protein